MSDMPLAAVEKLLQRFGLELALQPAGEPITASFWGDDEAGIAGNTVYVRRDTPLHSLLHETCHVICMDPDRRAGLDKNAGGDDVEEAAVCYLQILLADEIPGMDRARLMQDMDDWGYSFRLGSTRAWFERDASDAALWLRQNGLMDDSGSPTFRLRGSV